MGQAGNDYDLTTASPASRELERLRDKARHDEAQALRHARLKGREEGRVEGREEGRIEGREEGKQEGIFEVAKNMMKMGFSLDLISQATGLAIDELENYR